MGEGGCPSLRSQVLGAGSFYCFVFCLAANSPAGLRDSELSNIHRSCQPLRSCPLPTQRGKFTFSQSPPTSQAPPPRHPATPQFSAGTGQALHTAKSPQFFHQGPASPQGKAESYKFPDVPTFPSATPRKTPPSSGANQRSTSFPTSPHFPLHYPATPSFPAGVAK